MRLYRIYVDRKGKYKISIYDKEKSIEELYEIQPDVAKYLTAKMDDILQNAKLIHSRKEVRK